MTTQIDDRYIVHSRFCFDIFYGMAHMHLMLAIEGLYFHSHGVMDE